MSHRFTASFVSTGLTAAAVINFFSMLASSESRVEIEEISLYARSTEVAPAAIGVELWRGSTGGSTEAAITPVNYDGWPGQVSPVTAVNGATTAALSTTSAERLYAGGFVENQFCFKPPSGRGPVLDVSQRFHIRADNAVVSMNGSVTFREIGKVPS